MSWLKKAKKELDDRDILLKKFEDDLKLMDERVHKGEVLEDKHRKRIKDAITTLEKIDKKLTGKIQMLLSKDWSNYKQKGAIEKDITELLKKHDEILTLLNNEEAKGSILQLDTAARERLEKKELKDWEDYEKHRAIAAKR